MHQNVNCDRVEPVGEAPVGEEPIELHTKMCYFDASQLKKYIIMLEQSTCTQTKINS